MVLRLNTRAVWLCANEEAQGGLARDGRILWLRGLRLRQEAFIRLISGGAGSQAKVDLHSTLLSCLYIPRTGS